MMQKFKKYQTNRTCILLEFIDIIQLLFFWKFEHKYSSDGAL